MSSRPNIVLVVHDCLRYDRCGFGGHNPELMPNLMALAQRGATFHSYFSTGCPTQVAMPAIFSSAFPLDYGGYNHGIRRRPAVLGEAMAEAGYDTIGVTTALDATSRFGYARGFRQYFELVDLYHWFGTFYVKWLWEPLEAWREGARSDSWMLDRFEEDYDRILGGAMEMIDHLDSIGAPEGWRPRAQERKAILAERSLFQADPLAAATKVVTLKRHFDLGFGYKHAEPELLARIRRYERLERRANQPISLVTRRRSANKASLVNAYLRNALDQRRPNAPLFVYLHYLDTHESKFLVPQMSWHRAMRLPGDLARMGAPGRRGDSGGRLYDLSVSYVDRALGDVVSMLRAAGLGENTVFLITGDHGLELGSIRRGIGSDLSREFYDDYLHVPLVVSGADVPRRDVHHLHSSIDLAPTVLDIAGTDPPGPFRGESLLAAGRSEASVVRAENTGKGRCDLDSKPVYQMFRSRELKVMFECVDLEPREREVYDLRDDPSERFNLRDTEARADLRAHFLDLARQRMAEVRPAPVATASGAVAQ